jgi:hypothetical protein
MDADANPAAPVGPPFPGVDVLGSFVLSKLAHL